MKLYASPTSPYARFVRVVLLEKELDPRVTPVWVNPWDSAEALLAANPFSRIPVLEVDDGTQLMESAVIVLYLERRFPEPRLMPLDRVEHVHRKLGLAQGLMDAAVAVVAHRRFHGDSGDDAIVKRRLEALARALPVADEAVRPLIDRPDLGSLALACALGYLDFRLPELDWQATTRKLPDWYHAIAARASLANTQPTLEQPRI